ncbi:MAG: hypothetical protein LQ350_005601 [Teloschistes chrysophthalmus]|nr:MAG: hypothetical protein LQ350_005601 [Niorma chrysophthalma]
MPQSPTPRCASKRQEKTIAPSGLKAVDNGKSTGVYDTTTVRDRVRQWQSKGGGVVTAPDIYVDDGDKSEVEQNHEAKTSPEKIVRKSTPTRKPHKDIKIPETPREGDERQRHKSTPQDQEQKLSKSAPSKRVVSDAHWRNNRSPPKGKASPRIVKGTPDSKKSMTTGHDGIVVKPITTSTDEDLSKTRNDRVERSGKGGLTTAKNATPTSQYYSDRPSTPSSSDAEARRVENDDAQNAGTVSSLPLDNLTQRRSWSKGRGSPALGSSSAMCHTEKSGGMTEGEASRTQKSPSAYGSVSERKSSRKSQKGNILSQVFEESRKAVSRPHTIPVETPRVPSIEAWLKDTPDPFVDDGKPPPQETAPKPVRAERARSTPKVIPVNDPNKIWDALDLKDSARSGVHASRRRKRIPSSAIYEENPFPADFESSSLLHASPSGSTSASKLVDLVDDTSGSPSSSTRKGAREIVSSPKHAAKSATAEKKLCDDDRASAILSNPTVSSTDLSNYQNSLRSPGHSRRPFPSTGKHRLSTIASVDTLSSRLPTSRVAELPGAPIVQAQSDSVKAEALEVESGDQFDPDSLSRNKSRLAKHSDLMSVLSMPAPSNRSIRSARSIRTNRGRLATATVADLMNELSSDEKKYMRELRTLVDGVIPVLLTCVLSKSDSAVAADLFHPTAPNQSDPNFTKPIVDMGIALERLKTLHRRIPAQDANSLFTWAQGAQRVYSEYLKAWRMGFQDVVVNLAPSAESLPTHGGASTSENGSLEDGLPINKDGDVVNGDGERVDVAFLLKRPLVRLKYLAKTLKGLNVVSPSAEAEILATKYQDLVTMARNRSNEERARLEDEAAANIDATRARDPKTLAPMMGVSIDRTRRVRARDHFDLALQHSSGQCIDCRVELLLRDEASDLAGGGDLLVCEVDATGRWLLFPPIQFGRVSARNGDRHGEFIVMLRGLSGAGAEWHEMLSLRCEDEQSVFEWVQMLGLTPVPPALSRAQSFLSKHQRKKSTLTPTSILETPTAPKSPAKSRTPSPREVEIPIGEQPMHTATVWKESNSREFGDAKSDTDAVRIQPKLPRKSHDPIPSDVSRSPTTYVDEVNDLRSLPSQSSDRAKRESEPVRRPRSFKEALGLTGQSTNTLGLKRTRARKLLNHDGSPRSPRYLKTSRSEDGSSKPPSKPSAGVAIYVGDAQENNSVAPHDEASGLDCAQIRKHPKTEEQKDLRPGYQRAPSSMPSLDLPSIPKIRRNTPPITPIDEPEDEPQWSTPAVPMAEAAKPEPKPLDKTSVDGSPVELGGCKVPPLNAGSTRIARRRSSSPLKHEYEPSTASDSSDSDASTVDHHDEASSVSSSDDEELEQVDAPTPLLPLSRIPKALPQVSLYSLPNGTLKPSESASQAPYKKVPSQPLKASKTIASIFSWSEKGLWESLHADECSIVITPGLIEAFEMSAAHSTSLPLASQAPVEDVEAFSELASNITGPEAVPKNARPLVALELTPLVPLRRGTAIDISIRSPPTGNSQITSGNNIMFRSRNPEECKALYALINHSRIHNPTYIALQNARGPFGAVNELDRRASTRAGGSRMSSWFGGLGGSSSSYRASSAPTPSIAPSESSIGSMSSAFSALKRFGRGGGMFNIARSTISSREGSRANSLYTSSDNSSGSGASTPLPPSIQGDPHGSLGIANTKVRLYFRETQTRWRDMGSARLAIMRPNPPDLSSEPSASGESVARPSSTHQGVNEKRILVRGKTKGEILLDATLGETCFERVGRQGIAVSVWEDIIGPNGEVGTVGAVGGVGAGRVKVYMIQASFVALNTKVDITNAYCAYRWKARPKQRTLSRLLEDYGIDLFGPFHIPSRLLFSHGFAACVGSGSIVGTSYNSFIQKR